MTTKHNESNIGNSPFRVESVDIFRGMTMALMLFVNEVCAYAKIPHWILHAKTGEDMLGLSDIVFPLFCFIVGMSIPLAVANRVKKGDSFAQIALHTFWRTIALFIMGLFLVNRSHLGPEPQSMIPTAYYSLLSAIGFFLVWAAYPQTAGWKDWKTYLVALPRIAGVALLIFLIWQYKTTDGKPFTTSGYWEILGIIGWVYFVASAFYFHTKDRLAIVALLWIGFLVANLLNVTGILAQVNLQNMLLPSSLLFHAFGWGGVFTTVFMLKVGNKRPWLFIAMLQILGLLMLGAGYWSNHYWIISKNGETYPWLCYCTGIALIAFGILFLLVDCLHWKKPFLVFRPAGKATLTCYIAPMFVYFLLGLVHAYLPVVITEGWFSFGTGAILRSIVFAFLCIGLTQILLLMRIRLKL